MGHNADTYARIEVEVFGYPEGWVLLTAHLDGKSRTMQLSTSQGQQCVDLLTRLLKDDE